MERRPTPDPGSSERGEPDYAAARRHLKQNSISENEGLAGHEKRSPADAPNVEGPNTESRESDNAREAAAQRGRAAN
jgi:hypothetical protein